MRLLTIVGKVDTRVLAYPIARALSLSGSTALISDDGAYRRLFHGGELKGNVNGIDISVGAISNDDLLHSLDNTGIAYDNIVFVSSGYIPEESTGIIACHGSDRSMMGLTEKEKEQLVEKEKAESETSKEASGNKKKLLDKGKDTIESDTESNDESNIDAAIAHDKSIVDDIVKDSIELPDGIPNVEVHISYSTPSYKGITSIMLKESFMNYIYSCEEKKELEVYPDKGYNKTLAKILNATIGIDIIEAASLLERSEYIQNKKK